METYIYVLKLIPRLNNSDNWTKKDEELVDMHFDKLKKDKERGIVILAGRTENTDDQGFGIVIFYSKNFDDARKYMQDDPAVKGKVMTAEIYKYRLAIY